MKHIIPDSDLIRAASMDAANRNMRKHGRKQWNADDYAVASKEFDRLIELIPDV